MADPLLNQDEAEKILSRYARGPVFHVAIGHTFGLPEVEAIEVPTAILGWDDGGVIYAYHEHPRDRRSPPSWRFTLIPWRRIDHFFAREWLAEPGKRSPGLFMVSTGETSAEILFDSPEDARSLYQALMDFVPRDVWS